MINHEEPWRRFLKHTLRASLLIAAAVDYGYLMYWLITDDHQYLDDLLINVTFYGLFGVVMLLGLVGIRNHQNDKVLYCALLTTVSLIVFGIWFDEVFKYCALGPITALNMLTYLYFVDKVIQSRQQVRTYDETHFEPVAHESTIA